MQFNIHIGPGAVLAAALLAAGAWYAYDSGRLPFSAKATAPAGTASGKSPQFIPTHGGVLAIAWVRSHETFVQRSPSEMEVKSPVGPVTVPLPFGDTVSEIRTVAKYQYQIRLEKRWPIECTPVQCVVRTGPVELDTPVALYHEETERRTKSGWGRFDKAENLEALNRSLGQHLVARGLEPRNRDLGMSNGRAEGE